MKNVVTYEGKKYAEHKAVVSKFGITEEKLFDVLHRSAVDYYEDMLPMDEDKYYLSPYAVWLLAQYFSKQDEMKKHFKTLVNVMNEDQFAIHHSKKELARKKRIQENQDQRQLYVEENKEFWIEEGQEMKSKREELGISKNEMARMIGCSSSKLTRYENGEPINSPKMMKHGYRNVLKLHEFRLNEEEVEYHGKTIAVYNAYHNEVEQMFKSLCVKNKWNFEEKKEDLYFELIYKYVKKKGVRISHISRQMLAWGLNDDSQFLKYLFLEGLLCGEILVYTQDVIENEMKKEIA